LTSEAGYQRISELNVAGASVRGPRHAREGMGNQDHWQYHRQACGMGIVVSDGVGSCRWARIGSRAACAAVGDAMRTMTQHTRVTELTARIATAWRRRLRGFDAAASAATCLFAIRLRCGRLLAGGIGDGLAAVAIRDHPDRLRVIPLQGGDFGETVALGDGLGSLGWVVEEFDDRDGSHRVLLASDGVSNHLHMDRIGHFIDRLVVEYRGDSPREAKMSLKHMLRAWSSPEATDDRTMVVMWRNAERAR
jgi:hypothetical protein